MEKQDFVTVTTVQGELTASVIKGRLECEGIPVLLRYETLGQIYGLIVDGLGQVKVTVPRKYYEEAVKILEEKPDNPDNPDD